MAARKTATKKVAKKTGTKKPLIKDRAKKKVAGKTVTKRTYTRKPKAEVQEQVFTPDETALNQNNAGVDQESFNEVMKQIFAETTNPLLDVEVLLIPKEFSFADRMLLLIALEKNGYVAAKSPLSKVGMSYLLSDYCSDEAEFGLTFNHDNRLVSVITGRDVLTRPNYNHYDGISVRSEVSISEKLYLAPETVTIAGVTYNKAS